MKATNDFAELQAMWVNQKVAEVSLVGKETQIDSLLGKLKSLQLHQDRMNRIKLIIIILILGSSLPSVVTLGLQGNHLYFVLVGYATVIVSVISFFTHYLRNQLKVSKLPFDQSTEQFLGTSIHRLKKQNNIFKKPFLFFILGMLMGLNLLLWGMLSDIDLFVRIQLHGVSSAFLLLAGFFGYQFRLLRIKNEVLPIVEELIRVKENLSKD
jgi:hypothetical protein